MKITITQDFETVEEAAEFLARVGSPLKGVDALAPQAKDAPATEKPARKPRSDAGKPREPYGPRTQEANAGAGGAPSDTSAPATPAPKAASAAAPAAPVPAAASNPNVAPAAPVQPPPNDPAAAKKAAPKVEDFPLTLDGARAAMKLLNDAPGKGTEACILALREFGVNRISEVKPEEYKKFILHILASLPAAK